MGPSLCFLSAGLFVWAAGVVLRSQRGRVAILLGVALALLATQRISQGLDLIWNGGSLPLAEWVSFATALLFLLGLRNLPGAAGEAALAPPESAEPAGELAGLLEAMADSTDIWINTLDPQARVVFWNHAAERISGYRREEVQGRAEIWSWLYPDEAYRAEVAGKAAGILQRDEVARDLETTIRTKDGGTRILSWTSRALKNGLGQVTGSLAMARDITEIRATEAQFQRVHAMQNLILQHNVLGMAYVQDRRVAWANPRAAELFGIPMDQCIGASVRAIYPDDETYENLGRKAYAIMASGGTADHRLQMRRGNGQRFWCRIAGQAVDPTRPHSGSVWLAEDISQQMAAEAALSESEARFRGAFEGTQDALLLLTLDGIFDCNQKALDLFGFAHKSEMVRRHPADLSPARQPGGEDSRLRAMQLLQTALREGSVQFTWEHRRQDGALFPAEVLLSSFSMGRRKVIQACVRDIRERLAAEARLRESEARFRLLFERYVDAVVLLDSSKNLFVDYNQATLDMLRCTREELQRLGPVDISPEFQPDGRASAEKGPEMVAIAIAKGSHRFSWVHRSPHREDFTVEVLLTPIQPGASPLVFATWREIPSE